MAVGDSGELLLRDFALPRVELDGDERGEFGELFGLLLVVALLRLQRLADDAFGEVAEIFFERAVEEHVREDGHRRDGQEADGDEVDDEARLYLRAELPLAPLSPELEEASDEDEGEEEEGDEVQSRERVDEERVARRVRREDLPQPEELQHDEHRQQQQHKPAEEQRSAASARELSLRLFEFAFVFAHAFGPRGSLPRAGARSHSDAGKL